MISQETIERVREQADVVQIIGEHVKLRRVGSDYRGPCPFHHGRNPNFSVSPKRNVYHCFKCGESGDVFTFLQKHLGLDWPGAVRMAAEKSGIEIVETATRSDAPDPRTPLWEANAAAAEFYQRALWEGDAGAPAREYLAGRAIDRPVAERFGIGVAPREPEAFVAHLTALGFDEPTLLAAGLLVRREGESATRPRFRGRLIFPIFDAGGRTVGFGGRLLGPGEPKYLNSAESPVFSKGRLLYGLNWAKQHVRREDRVLVVEGYFDVVRLASAGVEAVVAPLGTALTESQAELLTKYTRNVFLLYDSDDAGQKATFRSGLELLRRAASVRVVTLPDGEDPDSFVQRGGREPLEAQLAAGIDLFDRQVQILERRGWFTDLHRKRRALDKLLPTLRATADPLTREMYVARAGEVAGVDRAVLLREVNEPQPAPSPGTAGGDGAPARAPQEWRGERQGFPEPHGTGFSKSKFKRGERRRGDRRGEWQSTEAAPAHAPDGGDGAERQLTVIMLADRSLVRKVAERFAPDDFREASYREIFAALVRLGQDAMFDEIESVLSPGAAQVLSRLVERGPEILDPTGEGANVAKTLDGAVVQLRVRLLEERSAAIKAAMADAAPEAKNQMLTELREISQEKQALGRGRFRTSGFRRNL